MVVKDEDTLQQALVLVDLSPVRYSDENSFRTVTSTDVLERLCSDALGRGSIAIVAPVEAQEHMESFSWELRRVRKERREDEKRKVRAWVASNPELAAKMAKRYFKEV